MECPRCQSTLDDDAVVKAAASILGRRGKGKSKARSTEQAKKAAHTMWDRRRRASAKST